MQFIGVILFVFSCIGMVAGIFYGNLNIGGYPYELSLALAWSWWSSALALLALAGICFSLPSILETLKDISSNMKKSYELQEKSEKLLRKNTIDTDFSKPGDAPGYPRAKGESDSDYWDRVTKGQHSADIQSKEDDPGYPRHSGELDDEYWKRVRRASSIQDGYKY